MAPDCMTADGYATAFMVLGKEKAVEVASHIPGIDYFFIYTEEKSEEYCMAYSAGMESAMTQH